MSRIIVNDKTLDIDASADTPLLWVLVALTVVITLLCIILLLQHPTALQDFWHHLRQVNPS